MQNTGKFHPSPSVGNLLCYDLVCSSKTTYLHVLPTVSTLRVAATCMLAQIEMHATERDLSL